MATNPTEHQTLFVKFRPESNETERNTIIEQQYQGTLVRWLPQITTAIIQVSPQMASDLLQTDLSTSGVTVEPPKDSSARKFPARLLSELLRILRRLTGSRPEQSDVPPQQTFKYHAPAVTRIEPDGEVSGCTERAPDRREGGEENILASAPPPAAPARQFDDPELETAYGLAQIQAIDAWHVTRGAGATVAVVDTGMDLSHPEFQGRIRPGFNFVDDSNNVQDDNGHGTHVCGVIGAALNNGQGAAGVAPECTIMPVKVLDSSNLGTWSDVVAGILYAIDQEVDILNLSLGASSAPPEAVQEAIALAVESTVVVAAAGNSASSDPFFPAAYQGVVGVAATNRSGTRWGPSNFGEWVKVAAPGENIFATAIEQNYELRSGTSMSAGFVSGEAALIIQTGVREPKAIIERILSTAETIERGDSSNQQLGSGLVNALKAVDGEETIYFPFIPGQ